MRRRHFLASTAALPVLGQAPAERIVRKGRIKQSVTKSFLGRMPYDEFCPQVVRLGLVGVDLVNVADWPTVQKYGLIVTCGLLSGSPGPLNRKESHDAYEKQFRDGIEKAAAAKVPNLVTHSGSRAGMPDQEGLDNCVAGLNRIKAIAEDKGVTVVLELLNSRVNHPDYMADHTAWGVEMVKRVNSPRIKLLYDIYHMQIMDGDIIRTIRQNIQSFGHIHTAGNPGRHEIDETQELNYKAISLAIVETGYSGYLAHEFTASRPDP